MGFHTNNSGWAGTGKPPAKTGGCACGCGGRGPDPAQGGALVQAMRMVVNAKIDAALDRAAPITTNADNKPLGPSRGVLSGKPDSTPQKATQGRVAAQGRSSAKATTKPTASAPLRPRGILSKKV